MNWNSTDRAPYPDEYIEVQDDQASIRQVQYPLVAETQNAAVYVEKLQRASNEILIRLLKR